MSVECSICERDLRGGHSPGCPRYRDPEPCQCGHADIDHDEEGVCYQCNCGLYKPPAASPVPPSAPPDLKALLEESRRNVAPMVAREAEAEKWPALNDCICNHEYAWHRYDCPRFNPADYGVNVPAAVPQEAPAASGYAHLHDERDNRIRHLESEVESLTKDLKVVKDFAHRRAVRISELGEELAAYRSVVDAAQEVRGSSVMRNGNRAVTNASLDKLFDALSTLTLGEVLNEQP
jgi:hypothetical protein